MGEVGEGCFKIWVYFSLRCSDLIDNKLNFPEWSIFWPMKVIGE